MTEIIVESWEEYLGLKNRRVVAQSGTCAFPFDITRPVDAILSTRKGVVTKLVLRAKIRRQALRQLYRMNITYATLFPDLDGLAPWRLN